MRLWLLLCGVLATVSCRPATSPGELGEAWPVVKAEWAIAQKALVPLGVTRSDLVKPIMFTWHFHDGPVTCGGVQANGCFTHPSAVIRINTQTIHVVRHEAGHAILWFLDHPCFRCISIGGNGPVAFVSLHSECKENDYCRRWIYE